MKKALILAMVMGVTGNVYAACPAKIDGKYSGAATSNTTFNGLPVTVQSVLSASISGGQTVINVAYDASNFGSATVRSPSPALPTSYDRSNCLVTVQAQSQIIGVVSDNGKTIRLIQGPTDVPGAVTSYTLNKQ